MKRLTIFLFAAIIASSFSIAPAFAQMGGGMMKEEKMEQKKEMMEKKGGY